MAGSKREAQHSLVLPPQGQRWGSFALGSLVWLVALVLLYRLGTPSQLLTFLGVLGAIPLICLALGFRGKIRWIFDRSLVGPLYGWEVLRLTRRGRGMLLRTAYALFLAAGLCIVYANFFTHGDVLELLAGSGQRISIKDISRFSRSFVMSTLILQGLAVLILTPPYFASAISEEKAKGTLELLFTTHLQDHEIVMGKLLARVTHLGMILLAGLPILSLAQLWGGVDILVVAAMTIVTLATLVSYGSICILVSVQGKVTWSNILTSYVLLSAVATSCGCVPLAFLTSPLGFLGQLYTELGGAGTGASRIWVPGTAPSQLSIVAVMVIEYLAVHATLAVVCLTWAAWELRSTARSAPPRPLPRPARVIYPDGASATEQKEGAVKPLVFSSVQHHPIGDHPLLWREAYHSRKQSGVGMMVDLFTILLAVFLVILFCLVVSVWANTTRELFTFIQVYINPCLRVGTACLGLSLCVGVGFRAAGTFSQERDLKTLDALLTLPVSRRAILGAKWLGSILRLRRLALLLAVLWVFGLLTTAIHPLAIPVMALAMAVHLAAITTIAIWLSLACRNAVSAYFATALVLMLMFLGSWLVLLNTSVGSPTPNSTWEWFERFLELGLNPVVTWYQLCWNYRDASLVFSDRSWGMFRDATALLTGLGVFALLGLLVWHAAEQRLGVEPRATHARRVPVT